MNERLPVTLTLVRRLLLAHAYLRTGKKVMSGWMEAMGDEWSIAGILLKSHAILSLCFHQKDLSIVFSSVFVLSVWNKFKLPIGVENLEITLIRLLPLLAVFRFAVLSSMILHEWFHLLSAYLLGYNGCFTRENVLGNTSMKMWLSCLNPTAPLPSALSPRVSIGSSSSIVGKRQRVIALSGWAGSAALWIFCIAAAGEATRVSSPWAPVWTMASLGSLCTLIASTSSDVISLELARGSVANFFCGNFGLIVARGSRAFSNYVVDALGVLEAMSAISVQRGGQTGGIVTFLKTLTGEHTGVRVRVCPSKRQSLPNLLRSKFSWSISLVSWWEWLWSLAWLPGRAGSGREDSSPVEVFLGHTRFATSSIPSERESHPHQWSPEQSFKFWAVDPVSGKIDFSHRRLGLYITHNGDFEFWNLFGRDRTHGEIGLWLAVVLGHPPSATCDSLMIAGLLELLRTQGLWMQSFRLAYYQIVMTAYEDVVDPENSDMTPSQKELALLSEMGETAFQKILLERRCSRRESSDSTSNFRSALSADDVKSLEKTIFVELDSTRALEQPPSVIGSFVVQAVANFLDNDLYWAVKKFFSHAKGSFGMTTGSTLDSDRVVLAALNQPLAIGVCPELQTVLFSSESQGLKVPICSGADGKKVETHVAYRFELDEDDGEIVEIQLRSPDSAVPAEAADTATESLLNGEEAHHPDDDGGMREDGGFSLEKAPFIHLRLHNRKKNSPVTQEEFLQSGRFITLDGNPFVSMISSHKDKDVVGRDINDIPRVLRLIRQDWASGLSYNRQTADAMFEMLKEKAVNRSQQSSEEAANRREIDILVVGVENSLWIGEQLAADLQNLLPRLRVVPISANKVIGVMGNARGAISTAGFSFCRISKLLTPQSLVLCISQSGQTFPTLHATRILAKHCPGRVFVCVGFLDSKMSGAVNQQVHSDAVWQKRVFQTHAGWREAEPSTVAAVACHATLTELMLFLAVHLRLDPELSSRPLGLRLDVSDLSDLQRIQGVLVEENSVALTGMSKEGYPVKTAVNSQLKHQGFRWAIHVLETPMAWFLSALYIFVTVILGIPIFTDIRRWMRLDSSASVVLAHALDSLVYCFLPLIFALLLRLVTGRHLLARIGMRTIVIADVPYVHQLLEVYVSKLFALSYWIATVEVHGANPIDHFVHRFTHRVKRGLLLAVGRPDGRLCSQTKCEAWVLMAILQARSIISLKTGAEVVTVGHNPHVSQVIDSHLALPSNRPKFLCEKLLGVEEFEPMKRMASRAHVVQQASGPQAFSGLDHEVVGSHHYLPLEGTLRRARKQGLQMFAHGRRMINEGEMTDPHARGLVLTAMAGDVQKLLDSQAALEEFTENRFLSLERLIAFQVLFHQMASTVASFWPLQFDTWRSQSCLRIATTAAPVSAADLEREWMDSMNDSEKDVTVTRKGNNFASPSSVFFNH